MDPSSLSSSYIPRVALVTGAAQGIGRAISLRLAADGFDVAINDVASNQANLDVVLAEIVASNHKDKDTGRRAIKIVADVTDENQVKDMIDTVVRECGGLDVMIANAGICRVGNLLATNLDDWDANFAVSVKGTFLCFKYAAQQMVAQGRGGRLVGASSIAGKIGQENLIAYCSAKFAVRGIVQCAALELGRYGITVNSYAPGAMATAMLEGIKVANEQRPESEKLYPGGFYNTAANRTAVGYLGKADDVASVVSYLVSKEAHYITDVGRWRGLVVVTGPGFAVIVGAITKDGGRADEMRPRWIAKGGISKLVEQMKCGEELEIGSLFSYLSLERG